MIKLRLLLIRLHGIKSKVDAFLFPILFPEIADHMKHLVDDVIRLETQNKSGSG